MTPPRTVPVASGTVELSAVDTDRGLVLRVGHSLHGHLGDLPLGDVAAARWAPEGLLQAIDDLIAEASGGVPRASSVPGDG